MQGNREIVHINIDFDSIFKYIARVEVLCPIGKNLDPDRYEVYDEFIYDRKEGENIYQEKDFCSFSTKIQQMRMNGLEGGEDEFMNECSLLLEKAPKTIKL